MPTSSGKEQASSRATARRSRRGRANGPASRKAPAVAPARPGMEGGRFTPLNAADLPPIDQAIRTLLETVGMAEAPPVVIDAVTARGGQVTPDGRLTFPQPLFDEALAGLSRNFTLYGQTPGQEMILSGKRVHVGTGGAAPQVVDLETGRYRDSTLRDLYDAARIVDSLDNIHFFSRSLVARDMPDERSLDINTAYACLAGTTKHVCTSITHPDHVPLLAEICFTIAGSQTAFVERPFISLNINHVVPPMRFHKESCEVMAEAVRLGIPVHANVFGQLGASSPVTLAGSVAQNVAESLAGMIFAWLINPDAKVILGCRPMITDLRTGAMTGGSGEQALVMAATTQMAHYYDLPNTCIAGAADSKIPDAQSGYEKALTVTLAAQAGSNMITQACGMQAGLMSVAFESYVIDNDMLGSILRSISPLEVNKTTLATDIIGEIVRGEGHFLGHPETLKRMQTDFLYPDLADRRTPQEWEADGSLDIRTKAQAKTREILKTHFPNHIAPDIDEQLRKNFDIRLSKQVMRPS
ncbi:MAG: trimethylamine methyltransferase family protein [Chloroflexota bacterium]